MENITASEVVGEIRKATRLYEVFKSAENMANVLSNMEQMERHLQKNIAQAKEELEKTQKAISDAKSQSDKVLASAKSEAESLRKESQSAREQASEVLRKAREETKAALDKSKKDVDKQKEVLAAVVADTKAAELVLQGLKKAQDDLIADLHSKRDAILKAFS